MVCSLGKKLECVQGITVSKDIFLSSTICIKREFTYYYMLLHRYFTHGCDFWSPNEAVVYHLWSRDHRPTPTPLPQHKQIEKQKQRISSQNRLRLLLSGGLGDDDIYGLGSDRTILEFEISIGVSFRDGIINDGVYKSSLQETCFADVSVGELMVDIGAVSCEKTDKSRHSDQKVNTPRHEGEVSNTSLTISALELVRQYVLQEK